MQLSSNRVYLLILGFAFVASWCLLIPNMPFVGLWVFFTGLTSLVYFFKKPKHKFDTALFAICLALSAFFLIRANGIVLFLDFVAVVFFGSLLTVNKHNHVSILNLLFSPFVTFLRTLSTRSQVKLNTRNLKHEAAGMIPKFDITKLVLSIGLTLVMLLVIVPVLASANPIFNNMIEGIIKTFDLTKLFKEIFTTNAIWNIARFIFAIVLFLFTTRMVSHVAAEDHATPVHQEPADSRIWLIPKVVLGVVLAAFFVTQMQLYSATAETLKALHYSNSQMTREVFGQLSFVSFVIFAMLFYDRSRSKFSQIITWFLIIESIFLIGVGFKSVYDYSSAWGFTYKRLYGFTFVFWLLAAFGLFAYKYLKRIADSTFLKSIVILTGITLICINVVNFDYLIYHVNPSRTGAGIDYQNLSELSPDAHSYKDVLAKVEALRDVNIAPILSNLISHVDYLQTKYRTFDIREFNLNEYQEYLDVKDIDLKKYRIQRDQAFEQQSCTGYTKLTDALANPQTCWLTLDSQNLTEFPMDILKLKNLRYLVISNNQITVIPEEINQLQQLTKLDIRNNHLTKLPDSITTIFSLRTLLFDNNAISQVPAGLFSLPVLAYISGSSNNIQSLPPEIGKAQFLRHLDFANNKLTSLPEEIVNAKQLDTIYFDKNQIQKFPGAIENWTYMDIFSASYNKLPPAEVERINSKFPNLEGYKLDLSAQSN